MTGTKGAGSGAPDGFVMAGHPSARLPMVIEWWRDPVSTRRRRSGRQAEDPRVPQPSRRRAVAEQLVECGKGVQNDSAVEPEEEQRQGEFAPEPREQGEPLVTICLLYTSDAADEEDS